MRAAVLAGAGLLLGGAAQAQSQVQTSAANNQAYINQMTAASVTQSVLNTTTFTQSGAGNRLGSVTDLLIQSALADGASNVFVSNQTSNGNMIGYTAEGGSMPLTQTGRANTAAITQERGDGNVLGAVTQTNQEFGGAGNDLVLVQSGTANYVLQINQMNNGRSQNTAAIRQIGNFNGYAAGHVFSDGRTAALNGMMTEMRRTYIGLADAPLALVFAANGISSYIGPGDGLGGMLDQRGGGDRATLNLVGNDNSFLVQQNSSTSRNQQGNDFTFNATGSSNYGYALQVGSNLASNTIVGSQNAFLAYQAGFSGAGANGYGNIVTWRQGDTSADVQNYAEMVQLGFNNTVTGSQVGQNNVFRGYQQGSNNVITASVSGTGNLIDVMQVGARNAAAVAQSGASNTATITQR